MVRKRSRLRGGCIRRDASFGRRCDGSFTYLALYALVVSGPSGGSTEAAAVAHAEERARRVLVEHTRGAGRSPERSWPRSSRRRPGVRASESSTALVPPRCVNRSCRSAGSPSEATHRSMPTCARPTNGGSELLRQDQARRRARLPKQDRNEEQDVLPADEGLSDAGRRRSRGRSSPAVPRGWPR